MSLVLLIMFSGSSCCALLWLCHAVVALVARQEAIDLVIALVGRQGMMFKPKVQKTIKKDDEKQPTSPKARPAAAPASASSIVRSIALFKYSDSGALFSKCLGNTEMTQCVVADGSLRNGVFYKIDSEIYAHLGRRHAVMVAAALLDPDNAELASIAANFPENQAELNEMGIVVRKSNLDPGNAGFMKWQVGFYADGGAEGAKRLMFILDGWLQERVESIDFKLPPPSINVYNLSGFNLNKDAIAWKYGNFEWAAAEDLPESLHPFVLPPPESNVVLRMEVHTQSETKCDIFWGGPTFAFSEACKAEGIMGAYYNSKGGIVESPDSDEKKELTYHRAVHDVDLSVNEDCTRVEGVLAEKVFRNAAMQIKVVGKCVGVVEAWLNKIASRQHMQYIE